MTLNIDQESCIKCGKCVRVCPSDIFTQERAGETIGLVRVESCIVCGHCVDVCPTGSVLHSEFPPEKTHTIDYSQLPFPLLPRRIAIITSPTAAGYEDFMNQLTRNKGGYPFYTKLFPALMQGERTEASVIAALDRIYQHQDLFDVVVIIRGGGATSDLNSFDSYLLAANCAQFPLPIITGIGHER